MAIPSLNKRLLGLRSKRMGESWENLFFSTAISQRIAITRVPDGCKQLGPKRIIRVKTPFDWIVTYKGRTALIDTKSTDAETFPNSQIDESQMKHLLSQEIGGAIAGYIIWFRTLNQVVFVPASSLYQRSKVRGSIDPAHVDVRLLGSALNLNLVALFDA